MNLGFFLSIEIIEENKREKKRARQKHVDGQDTRHGEETEG
jgi:hypothetical protein